jgi:hypothetical protein
LLHRSSATRHGQHQQSCTSRLHHMHQTDRCQLSHTTHECMLPYSQAEPGLSALCTPSTHRRAGLYACMHAAAIMPVSGVSECLSRWVRMPLTMDPLLLPTCQPCCHTRTAGRWQPCTCSHPPCTHPTNTDCRVPSSTMLQILSHGTALPRGQLLASFCTNINATTAPRPTPACPMNESAYCCHTNLSQSAAHSYTPAVNQSSACRRT